MIDPSALISSHKSKFAVVAAAVAAIRPGGDLRFPPCRAGRARTLPCRVRGTHLSTGLRQ